MKRTFHLPRMLVLLCLAAFPFQARAEERSLSRDMKIDKTLDAFDANKAQAPEVVVTAASDDPAIYSQAPQPQPAADPEPAAQGEARPENELARPWELGTEAYMFHYREPGLMHDNAWMWGIYASYTYHGWLWPAPQGTEDWMLRLDARYAWGRPDYHGGLQDGMGNVTPYKSWGSHDYVYELRAVEGYDFYPLQNLRLTPFAGIAYRHLNDDPPSGDVYAYSRKSNYYYSPLGIETASRFGILSVGTRLEYDYFWYGVQYSYLEDTFKNSQDKGRGFRASLRLGLTNRYFDIVFEPFIRYWHIRQSDPRYVDMGGGWYQVVVEPDNRTLETGARLGIGF